jgi:glutamyl/glutaminyl-tRNA synthetase
VLDYAAQGYLPQALTNFIALIGWSPGEDREFLTPEELIETFDIARIQPSPGHFDIEKLNWLNGHTIRTLSPDDLWNAIRTFAAFDYAREYHHAELAEEDGGAEEQAKRIHRWTAFEKLAQCSDQAYALAAMKLAQERVVTLVDFGEACDFFFTDEPVMDEKAVAKWFAEPHVPALLDYLETADGPPTAENYELGLRNFMQAHGIEKFGPVVHPTRVALTGRTTGPGLFELMEVLGPARITARAQRARALLG